MGFKTYSMERSLKCLKLLATKERLQGQILHSFAATVGHYFLQNGEMASLKFDNFFLSHVCLAFGMHRNYN